jgi:DNA-binding response OmpR family regulator
MKPPAPKPAQKFQLLVVDYDSARADAMLSNLAELNMECRYASSGQIALQGFTEQLPHLVLLDVMMPGLDGYEVCRRMRSQSTVPIILMNESVTDEHVMKGLKTGADDYILKSTHKQVLAAHIIAWLRRVYQYDKCEDAPVSASQESPSATTRATNGSSGTIAPAQSRPPAGWLRCDTCAYMGPRTKFEQPDPADRDLYCPVCHSRVVLSHSL